MKNPMITIGGRIGRIFEGAIPQTYCFVPEDFITSEAGSLCVAEGDYMRSGWDVRNMRYNDEGGGDHLFPDPRRPVSNLDDATVKAFIQRIDIVRTS